ncbi:MAG: type pilus assembly protein PilN [Betaproteobacteria bacterium]|jgi:type IV pilus assembly protein PilN|nr:type pilus assembly protein PilN [Betaproteobacteria bacterium]
MTVRVNLLPHREERRKRQRQHFFVLAGGTAMIGLLLVVAMHTFYQRKIDTQLDRNTFLKSEIAKLDQEIAEIDSLKAEIAALLARKQVIETLQRDRAQTVHLLDELVRQMPEGVYVRAVTQKGLRIDILGFAQSNARVSTLMRNIDSSPWLEKPVLVQVNAATVDKKRVSEFSMFLFLKRAVEVKPAPAATTNAPAAAKK